uniref:Uncharacterized protein n=1 Tax=Arundo donax TaxID=35708 RepID=A0A0A9BU91_ARUDO
MSAGTHKNFLFCISFILYCNTCSCFNSVAPQDGGDSVAA